MSWEIVLKVNWASKNLPMLKEGIEELYSKIPVGEVFRASDYWEDFQKIIGDRLEKTREFTYFRRWVFGRGPRWFRPYFIAYGKNRGYVVINTNGKMTRI